MPNVQYKPGNEDAFIADLHNLMERQTRYALRLMQSEPWDFFMVHFLALDVAQHALWAAMDETHPRHDPASPYKTAIRDLYRRADEALAQFLNHLDGETIVLIMSDHGFGPLHRVVNLNNLLLRAGLLRLKPNAWVRLKAGLFRRGLTPVAAYDLLKRLGLQNLVWRVSKQTRNKWVDRFLSFEDVDWSHTLAYAMGHVGQIYINRKGREPQGIVEPHQVEGVRQRVIAALQTLRDPQTGRPLLERVIPGEEAAQGPYAHLGPDLHVVLDGYRCIAFPLFAMDGKIITQQIRGDSGCHRREGIFLAWGPGVRPGVALQGARIVDLAPTILWLMGLSVPDHMDGRPLVEAFAEARAVNWSLSSDPRLGELSRLTAEEEAEVEARLRSLGYLG